MLKPLLHCLAADKWRFEQLPVQVRGRWLATGKQLLAVSKSIVQLPAELRAEPQGELLARKLPKLANLPDPQLVQEPAHLGGDPQSFYRKGVQRCLGL